MVEDRLLRARAAFEARDWAAARDWALQSLAAGADPTAFLLAGAATLRLGQPSMALAYLERAAAMRPQDAAGKVELARALFQLGEFDRAAGVADSVGQAALGNGYFAQTLGAIYGQLSLHAKALPCFQAAVTAMPGDAEARYNLASELSFAGDFAAAERELDACIRLDPHHWRAWLSRTQLRTQTAGSNHVEALRTALDAAGDPQAQLYLNMAIAKELEDLGEYDGAFEHLVAGKRAGRSLRNHGPVDDGAMFAAIEAAFAEAPPPGGGFADEAPIFVFGMPRSGTTLVDRILSSHPLVRSIGESRNFIRVLQSHVAPGPEFVMRPGLRAELGNVDWAGAGKAYVDSVRRLGVDAPRFVDKLPHNFLYAGFIARALPAAKLVLLRRDPMDTCLANFRQLFAAGSPYFDYSYDILDSGRYYLLFHRLMAHWHRVLPGRMLEVSYEDLVGDQAVQTRRLLEFCGLPWHQDCLDFHRNPAPTGTASAVQVRQPLHRERLQRWKHFEPQLRELRALLEAGGIRVPD